ncbi:MAG TPA: hypothetical protein PLC99_13415 [Verrucomicrobiota bacterium]|nr:hypothetical protein [Verrucomicrobiota bacterium]
MADFNRIGELVDPQTIAEKVSSLCALARHNFQVKSNTASSFRELVEVLSRFVQHFFSVTCRVELPEDVAFSRAEDALKGRGLSLKHVYDDCRRGTNGGLKRTLDVVAEQLEQEQVHAYIEYVFATMVDQQNFDEIAELMNDYARKYGRYMPFELRSVPALVANWKAIILETSSIMSRLRSFVGKP